MKKSFRYILLSLVILFGFNGQQTFAGNPDRSGQAGAAELLINPWAASSGWGNAGMASIHGVEAMFGNVAGISKIQKFDLNFSHTSWLVGSEVRISSFGLLARVGESSVLGLSVMSFSLGEIPLTTVENPDPGVNTYKPSLLNLNIAFAKTFSNSISGGFVLKIINEQIANMGCNGVAIDAGIQYVSGPTDNIHFGITLKNIGPTMKFSGDGLSLKAFLAGYDSQITLVQRADQFELPTQLNIAAGYDFNFENESRFTLAGNFTSNSFTKDQITLGAEYSWREYLQLRAGYTYEQGIWSGIEEDENTNLSKGLSAGCSVQVPLTKNENGLVLGIDYSFRATSHFNGTHSVGARIIF